MGNEIQNSPKKQQSLSAIYNTPHNPQIRHTVKAVPTINRNKAAPSYRNQLHMNTTSRRPAHELNKSRIQNESVTQIMPLSTQIYRSHASFIDPIRIVTIKDTACGAKNKQKQVIKT